MGSDKARVLVAGQPLILRVLAQCGVSSDEVAWFIPHQAN
jgi:3-oxoacyl-[acyl-carrier-protein] synthase III